MINYSDGSEDKLRSILSDGFDENESWKQYKNDWAVHYHLSPLRKNLLNWINWGDRQWKVLELGAGCGAITSYFNTLPNVSITSVEGSSKRAELISLRCKNAKVVTSSIQDFRTDEKYDLVLLVGVLEYSGKYFRGSDTENDVQLDPFQSILTKAVSFLNENGILALAIENQQGHKYLAGMKEDHYGKSFEGVSNYPNYNGIRTFDKTTLKNMLDATGLKSCWYYPSPDYKMPTTILSNEAFKHPFDWLTLLSLPSEDCYGGIPGFNEREFLKSIRENSDPSVFMNSFLVFASKTGFFPDSETIAVKINKLRKKSFNTITKFTHACVLKNGIPENYHSGYKNLCDEIVDAIYLSRHERAYFLLMKWYDLINFKRLTNKDVELTPTNILFIENRRDMKVIDLEFNLLKSPLDIQTTIDRGMLDVMTKINRFDRAINITEGGEWNLPKKLKKLLPPEMINPDLRKLSEFESWYRHEIFGGDLKAIKNNMDEFLGLKISILSSLRKILKKLK